LGTLKQYVDDMLTINEAFKKRFGQSYDTTTLKGVEGLLGWALSVEADMRDLMERNKGMSPEDAHNKALRGILDWIENSMEEFPGPKETGYLGGGVFAINPQQDDSARGTFSIDEPVAFDEFERSLF
ncbi:MAG: hypothetical protein AB7E08_03025, partial [Candidatus Omnitrophota bacterium]